MHSKITEPRTNQNTQIIENLKTLHEVPNSHKKTPLNYKTTNLFKKFIISSNNITH